ncbi:MAG: hypothetical protein KDA33_14430 [Phycisphaerales bacterium]|nr:hypothetical protein [Phycisphaerales bacterium]
MRKRRILIAIVGAMIPALALSLESAVAQPNPVALRVVSPVVQPDGAVVFRVYAPKAAEVKVTGPDIPDLGPGKAMTKNDEGVWELTLGPLPAGAYRYVFNIDDVSVVDPKSGATAESNGKVWSLVRVPGSKEMDTRDAPHGAVSEVTYYSSVLKRNRRMHVYTPPGYEKGDETYPVLYLLHGAFDCDDAWTSVGRAGDILDNLIADGKATPMIVVMPMGHKGPFQWGEPLTDATAFIDEFTKDVMPNAERRYRVRADRAHRAIAGLSMGGDQSLNVFLEDMNRFAYVGVFSSGVFAIGRQLGASGDTREKWLAAHERALDDAEAKKGLRLIWFAIGRDDFLLDLSRETVELLKGRGFEPQYKETAGGHTWLNWRNYLIEFAPKLFR